MIRVTSPEIQDFEKDHIARLRRLAPDCMVLLKKNGDFPLSSPCPVALFGSGARETVKGGTDSGDVNVRHFASVEEGLENAGFTVTTKGWLSSYSAAKAQAQTDFLEEIKAEAAETGKPAILVGMGRTSREPRYTFPLDGEGDVCIYVLARNSGEGADRKPVKGDYLLTDDEVRDIRLCAKRYRKFMLVLNVGGPVDISPVLDVSENILLLSQLGTVTGDAFADVLLGKASPSGRLTTTWVTADALSSLGEFAERDDTRYHEDVFVGYRGRGAEKPLFPFGFGLGYTDFRVKTENFEVADATVKLTAVVENIGKYKGKETLQLYYSAPQGKAAKPLRELGAYQKTGELLPGERETIELTLPVENMAYWDTAANCWALEKGDYVIFLGETPVGVVELDEDVVTAAGIEFADAPDFEAEMPVQRNIAAEGLPRVVVQAKTLKGIGHFDRQRISSPAVPAPDLSGFSNEELAQICVGKHVSGGASSFIGNSASRVAGGAGETADLVSEKGFGTLVLADGPAGLRLATTYVETPSGQEGLDAGGLEFYLELLPEPLRALLQMQAAKRQELAKTYPVLYHYASAIPIGTALAQAWDPFVPEACGDLVGEEMESFGVNVWLAPALNIHRNPLCGRNFEYYSEDPLLSGRTAAAVTRGVQKHKNCAVTIKHFCCNNQETNRFGSNSVVSARALREIYLKGFEICVKESSPAALMSSYNLLNGIHTANRRDLLTDVLRGEWGFDGFVMTDWGTTDGKFNLGVYGPSSPALCIKAGNDLIMPGSDEDVGGILSGLEKGEISREDLEICAGRVLTAAKMLSQ